jgi:hypothetical protein
MHRALRKSPAGAWGLGLLVALLILGGCGGGSGAAETAQIDLKSPAVSADGIIKPSVTCGLGALWLPLRWGAAPAETKELAVYLGRFEYKRVDGRRKLVIPYADLVYHIKPSVHEIAANTLPKKVSWSNFGNFSCPPAKRDQTDLQALFALDRTRHQRTLTRELATRLTEEALRAKGKSSAGPRPPGSLTEDAAGIGRFIATYAR